MQKTIIRWLIAVCLSGLALTGCQPQSAGDAVKTETALTQASAPRASQTAPQPTITSTATPEFLVPLNTLESRQILLWHPWAGETGTKMAQWVDGFNASNEWGITVKIEQPGSSMLISQKMQSTETSVLPQVVIAPSEDLLTWYTRDNAMVALNDFIQDAQWGFSEQQRADIPLVFWQQDQVDGTQIGVPVQRSAQAIFYNLTWGAELGFRDPPATSADLKTQACAAAAANDADANTENNGSGGWIVDTDGLTIYTWIKAFGMDSPYSPDLSTLKLEQPATRLAFEYLRDLVDEGCAWSARLPAPEDYFASRQALFYTADLRTIPQVTQAMQRANNTDQWMVLPFPGSDRPTVVVSGLSYGIVDSTPENNLAAWLFIRWMNQTQQELSLIEAGGGLPVSASANTQADAYRKVYPQWSQAVQWIPYAQAVPTSGDWQAARLILGDAAWQALQSYLPADQLPSILSQLDDTLQEVLAEQKISRTPIP